MDAIIRQAELFDGLGSAPWVGDVGIRDGRIAALAPHLTERADREVEADGLALGPGFIDMHSHSDESMVIDPLADGKIRQGVTTEVIGNCSMSVAPLAGEQMQLAREQMERYHVEVDWTDFAGYFRRLEAGGLGPNCVALVGHGNLRRIAVGCDNRAASEAEMAHMEQMLEEALRQGAWGVSSGLIYVPSCFAPTIELIRLANVSRENFSMYASHIRGEGDTLEAAVDEAIAIGEQSGCLVEVSHHKASGLGNWGKVRTTLPRMQEARARGVRVYCDVYPYTASSTELSAVFPRWAVEGGTPAMLERLRQAEARSRISEVIAHHPYGDWTRVQVASVKRVDGPNAYCPGLNMEQVAKRRGQTPEDACMDLVLEEDGDVAAIYFSMCDEDVDMVMRDPHTVIGSDASARGCSGLLAEGQPHPRTFGTFPRMLGHYCRERGVLPLGEAIRRMSSMTAQRLGLRDRGRIAVGCWADLVAFDKASVSDTATFERPFSYPRGIVHVWVNGVAVVRDGEPTGALPGRVLRLGRDGQVAY